MDVLPLYYAGLSGKAEVAVGDDAPFKTFALDAVCRTAVEVEIPANGNIRIYVRKASGHCMNAGFVTRQNVYVCCCVGTGMML